MFFMPQRRFLWESQEGNTQWEKRAEVILVKVIHILTLTLLTWTIWRAPTNASKWRMGFKSAFKGLNNAIWTANILYFTFHHTKIYITSLFRPIVDVLMLVTVTYISTNVSEEISAPFFRFVQLRRQISVAKKIPCISLLRSVLKIKQLFFSPINDTRQWIWRNSAEV